MIISYEEWCEVQAEIRDNFRHAQAKTHPLFQHLLYCSTCHHFMSAHGNANGRTKYACENDREGRVRIGCQAIDSEQHKDGRYYCGQQLWEEYLEFSVVQALDLTVREWKPVIDLSREIQDLRSKLNRANGVYEREKADQYSPDRLYEVARRRMETAKARVEELQ